MAARRTPVRRGVRRLRARLRYLYHGQSVAAVRFRLAVIVVDIALIGFFIAAPLLRETPFFLAIDYFVAFILALDLCARALASRSLRTWAKRPIVWVDAFVLLTLLAPGWLFNWPSCVSFASGRCCTATSSGAPLGDGTTTRATRK